VVSQVCDQSLQQWKIYINGAQQQQQQSTAMPTQMGGALTFGSNFNGTRECFLPLIPRCSCGARRALLSVTCALAFVRHAALPVSPFAI
jgi:hypothetical protein